jgi:hypothetical protein
LYDPDAEDTENDDGCTSCDTDRTKPVTEFLPRSGVRTGSGCDDQRHKADSDPQPQERLAEDIEWQPEDG